MKPVITLIGCPNVGKSTLFNRLTSSRDALVANFPELTRDRHYGEGYFDECNFLVIDTGGFLPTAKDGIMYQVAKQTKQAIIEADIIMFIVDGRQGLTVNDKTIANFLRRFDQPIMLLINKTEGMKFTSVTMDFYELGFNKLFMISAAHGDGISDLLYAMLKIIDCQLWNFKEKVVSKNNIKIAIVGRPNVGKSTLVNTLVGEERVITFDMPGTTRDSIEIPFKYSGKNYTLIDTAGIRQRSKVLEIIEKFSIIKTLKSILEANVVLLLLDSQQDISEQDAHIAQFILQSGRALVVGVNKWDSLKNDRRAEVKIHLEQKLHFLSFANFHYISGQKCLGVHLLMKSINLAFAAAITKLTTPKLTRALIEAVAHQKPHRQGFIRPKLRYAHQGGQNPPVVVIHGNALENLNANYKRYLEKYFRKVFSLIGTPLRIEFRSSKNPFLYQNK